MPSKRLTEQTKTPRKTLRSNNKSRLRALGVRSGLEEKVTKQLNDANIEFEYEPSERIIRYVIPESKHTYLPDFVIQKHGGGLLYVESKGRWTYDDRYKHLLIRSQWPELDIRFVFSNANSRISKGSPTTYGDVCEGRGRGLFKGVTWKYGDKGVVPSEWLLE